MKKGIIFTFFAFPSFFVSFIGYHQGSLAVQPVNAGNSAVNSPAGNSGTSLNWAGYVASGGAFTSVGSTWTIPQATSSNGNLSADATWVGIGGVSGTDLIQAGTQTIFQNGTPTYQAWYELLPASLNPIPLTVHPNDTVTVSIVESSNGQWQISFNDSTTGQNYQTSVSYSSSLSSAEWIEEMPSDARSLVPLDNFGTVSFNNSFTVENGSQVNLSGSSAEPVTMITNAGQSLATPSSLGTDGASFTVTRSSNVANSAPTTFRTSGRWSRTGVGVQGYAPMPRGISRNIRQVFPARFSFSFKRFGGNARTEFQSLLKFSGRVR